VKCDMCKGQKGGPACVRSCPTGAALRVSPEKFLDYTE
jgi:cGMP-dependent protein kinase 2